MNALALGAEEGRGKLRKAAGSCKQALDPQISEWGNPAGVMCSYPYSEYIVYRKGTRGTETSKYPEEEKEKSIPKVAASERGRAQTDSLRTVGVVDSQQCDGKYLSRRGLERPTEEGESPVGEKRKAHRAGPEYHGARETLWEAGRTISQG